MTIQSCVERKRMVRLPSISRELTIFRVANEICSVVVCNFKHEPLCWRSESLPRLQGDRYDQHRLPGGLLRDPSYPANGFGHLQFSLTQNTASTQVLADVGRSLWASAKDQQNPILSRHRIRKGRSTYRTTPPSGATTAKPNSESTPIDASTSTSCPASTTSPTSSSSAGA